MANIIFKRGLLANLPATKADGTFYVTTDERALYLDVGDNRIRLGDFQEYAQWSEIQALSPKDLQSTALYYAVKENVLAKYDSNTKKWKQINPDTYVSEIGSQLVALNNVNLGTGETGVGIQTTVVSSGGAGSGQKSTVQNIIGAGSVAVSNRDNNLVITGTDTKVTSRDNHYNPTTYTTNLSDATVDAKTTSTDAFVTGIKTDGKGHIVKLETQKQTGYKVTGVAVTPANTPSTTNNVTITTQVSQNETATTVSDSFQVIGAGATTVNVANEKLTITSVDEHTTYAGHYVPTAEPSSKLNVGSNKVITDILKDAKGHVTGIDTRAENDIKTVAYSTNNTNHTITTTVTSSADTAKADSLQVLGSGSTTVTMEGKTVTIHSSYVDECTTEDGHYTPVTKNTDTSITPTANQAISAIDLDSKKHVVGVTKIDVDKVTGITLNPKTTGTENTITLESSVATTAHTKTDSVTISGGGATTVSADADNDKITISSTDREVTSAEYHYKAPGVANGTKSASTISNIGKSNALAETPVVTGVTTDAAGHVTGITGVKIADTHSNIHEVIGGVRTAANGGGFTIKVSDTDGVSKIGAITPTIKYGSTGSATAAFDNGVATLNVMTKSETEAEIGKAIANTSAMVLKGEVNESKPLPIDTSKIAAGDTYLVTAYGTYAGQTAESGDLFVAKEDNKAEWYYVPSGNDVTKLCGDSTSGQQGFYLTEGDENTATSGSRVIFTENTNIKPTVTQATNSVNVSFNMVWETF